MAMWIVTEEDEDGIWFDGPHGFSSEHAAREFASKMRPPTAGYEYVLHECREVAVLRTFVPNRCETEGK